MTTKLSILTNVQITLLYMNNLNDVKYFSSRSILKQDQVIYQGRCFVGRLKGELVQEEVKEIIN